jgi:hypothetical protein
MWLRYEDWTGVDTLKVLILSTFRWFVSLILNFMMGATNVVIGPVDMREGRKEGRKEGGKEGRNEGGKGD